MINETKIEEDITVLEKKVSKTSKLLSKKIQDQSDDTINKYQTILIQDMIEEISKICFEKNYDSEIAKTIILKIVSNTQIFKNAGLPGAIWETIEDAVKTKLQNINESLSEFENIFNTIQLQILKRFELGKISVCC